MPAHAPPALKTTPLALERFARYQQNKVPPESALAGYAADRVPANTQLHLSPDPLPTETAPPADARRLPFMFNPTDEAGLEIPVVLVLAEPHLHDQLTRLVRAIYAVHGSGGLAKLARTVDAQGTTDPESGMQLDPLVAQVETVLDEVRGQLVKAVAPALAAVTKAATTIGVERVNRARQKILRSAATYLGVSEDKVRKTLDGKHTYTGPAMLGLARAIVKIAEAREDYEGARDRRWIAEIEAAPGAFMLLANAFRSIREGKIASAQDALFRLRQSPVRQARDEQVQRETKFHITIDEAAFEHPIVYAIWDMPEIAAALTPVSNNDAKLAEAIEPLRDHVIEQILRSLAACDATEKRLSEGTLDVWRYQPLVEAARLRLGIPHGTVEHHAIDDKVSSTSQSVIGTLSMLVGAFEFALLPVAGMIPPFVAAVGLVSFVLAATDLLISMWDTRNDEDAWNACFDPNDSFAVVPGHKLGIVTTIVGLLLFKGQVRIAKELLR